MLETALLIFGYIGTTAFVGFFAYIVGHMHGGAKARARWVREEGRW